MSGRRIEQRAGLLLLWDRLQGLLLLRRRRLLYWLLLDLLLGKLLLLLLLHLLVLHLNRLWVDHRRRLRHLVLLLLILGRLQVLLHGGLRRYRVELIWRLLPARLRLLSHSAVLFAVGQRTRAGGLEVELTAGCLLGRVGRRLLLRLMMSHLVLLMVVW